MVYASGCIFLSLDTGRICLQLRGDGSSHSNTWGFWGGKSEDDERPIQTLLRELKEEIGMLPDVEKVYPLNKFVSKDRNFEYTVFVVTVFEEFIPTLNMESAGYAWVDLDRYPRPLHKGAQIVLSNSKMIQKIKTIYNTKKNTNTAANWLDDFKPTG